MTDPVKVPWIGAVVNSIWRINPITFKYSEVSGGWGNTIAATMHKNKIYCAMRSGKIWEVDSNLGNYIEIKNLDGWNTCLALVAHGDHLYAFCKNLHRITISSDGTGFYQQLSEGWENTVCATVFNDKIYAITRNGKLWEVDPSSGVYNQVPTELFEGAMAITSLNGFLYIFGRHLFRVDPLNPGTPGVLGDNSWQNVINHCAVATGENLFAVTNDGKLLQVNPQDGSSTETGLNDWDQTKFLFPILVEMDRVIIELTQKLLNAIIAGDWDTYAGLCDSNLTAFEPEAEGTLVEGLEFHKFYFDYHNAQVQGTTPFRKNATIASPKVRVLSPESAVISYIRLNQSVKDGVPRTTKSEETRVWQQVNGKWKHVHFHRSVAH